MSLDYGVDDGRQQVVTYPSSRFGRGSAMAASATGPIGRASAATAASLALLLRLGRSLLVSRGFGDDIDVYTVYTSFLDMDIRRPDGQAVFEGTARARSRTDELSVLVPNLIEAMFTGFPGNSGETVKITVAPERKR